MRIIYSLLLCAFFLGSSNAGAYCSIYGECAERHCVTAKVVHCPGSGLYCGGCGADGAPCITIVAAIPYPGGCATCSGTCTYQVFGDEDSVDGSLSIQTERTDASIRQEPRFLYDLHLSEPLSELDALSEDYPHHAAMLLRFEYIDSIDRLDRPMFYQVFTSVAQSRQALDQRKDAGASVFLNSMNSLDLTKSGSRIPLDRVLEVLVNQTESGQIEISIESRRFNEQESELLFEARSVITASPLAEEAGLFTISNIDVHTDEAIAK